MKPNRYFEAAGLAGGGSRRGMTLVEVVIAMGVMAVLCLGLYRMGIQARRTVENNRLATEARTLARSRLEEMLAVGFANLAVPGCTLTNSDTNSSSLGYVVTRQPHVIWHTADGGVTNDAGAMYAEASVRVSYYSPLAKRSVVDAYSTLIPRKDATP